MARHRRRDSAVPEPVTDADAPESSAVAVHLVAAGKRARDTAINNAFAPLAKRSLSDSLVRRIKGLIHTGHYKQGDRLPSIMEMARRFGVGHPTIREALKILETTGVVEIRHGSGVFVARSEEVLVLASPDFSGTVTKKLLVDLIGTRMPLEMQSAADAVRNATKKNIQEMHRLLAIASQNLADDDVLSEANMSFHREIAVASGNMVLSQLLDVLQELFTAEQRLILGIFGSRERDHKEHIGILEALEQRNEALCVERMRLHLEGVRAAILRWDVERHPVA
jgi:GntR family transcriptional repressor for pyruvate dehydrogenase complex